ncbi:MAG TPA: NAD(P)H-dependent oxidoreductase [Kofleriaceae bacterium]|jgi:glutathione-regulated potassium-efflux system ancillary protein KefG|nr:NAD(P)H-dependent oxidoreductase [Kofleriaceae bacterium]
MRRILILFAHPVLERSRVNRRLLAAVRDVAGVTVHDLYDAYPTLYIDVKREQRLLLDHDVIVFQHPFYWYSTPAILKEWQDLVLEHGWAYGHSGTQLRGKITFNAITTGGPEAAYRSGGYNRFTIRELLAPWDQTAHLCGMRFLAPFTVHAALRVVGEDDVAQPRAAYRQLIEALRDDRLDLERAATVENLAASLPSLLPREVA